MIEAVATLAFASLAIRLATFATIARMASRPLAARPNPLPGRAEAVSRVARAVAAAANRAPWRAVCFQRGLAAHLMLRRRGLPSTLFYGVSDQPGRGLIAHVWVRQADLDVIGCETAAENALLATFPALQEQAAVAAHLDQPT